MQAHAQTYVRDHPHTVSQKSERREVQPGDTRKHVEGGESEEGGRGGGSKGWEEGGREGGIEGGMHAPKSAHQPRGIR